MDDPVSLENLAQISDEQLVALKKEGKVDAQSLFHSIMQKIHSASITQRDSQMFEHQAQRLVDVCHINLDHLQEGKPNCLTHALIFWSIENLLHFDNKLWNFYMRNQCGTLNNVLDKVVNHYLIERNQYLFLGTLKAVKDLIKRGAKVTGAVVASVQDIADTDPDYSLRKIVDEYASLFRTYCFMLFLCAKHEEFAFRLLPREILLVIADKAVVSTFNDKDLKERADAVAAMVARQAAEVRRTLVDPYPVNRAAMAALLQRFRR